jgi:hypothetical protein
MPAWYEALKGVGQWIWPAAAAGQARGRTETALFRGRLLPPPEAVRVELHVSAEGRYTLWVNDGREPLGRGPARTDLQHRSVDTYEVALAGAGQPIELWAQVRWWAGLPDAPLAEVPGSAPGFLLIALFLNGRGEVVGKAGTGAEEGPWRAAFCPGLTGAVPYDFPGFVCIGEMDVQRSAGWPVDWRRAATDSPADAAGEWAPPRAVGQPYFRDDPAIPWGTISGHGWLTPRDIAFPAEWPVPVRHVVRLEREGGIAPVEEVRVHAGAGEVVRLRADVGEEVLAYLRVKVSGRGTTVAITGGEVLMTDKGKSFRLEDGGRLTPLTDRFTHDRAGGVSDEQVFETSHWRAFRFLDIEVVGGDDGGELLSLELVGTGYPLERAFEWEAGGGGEVGPHAPEEVLQKIADVSWRTLRCCTWETYMDCPYYEQMQYVGDTRLQCLLTYVTTGDATLPAQAIRAFDRSRVGGGLEGLTQSRFPCPPSGMQVIPTFSLLYILMIEDYLRHTGDEGLVAEVRPGIAPILNWFSQHTDPASGLIGTLPYWPFVDWVYGWDKGMPPHGPAGVAMANGGRAGGGGASSIINLHYLMALQSAAAIYERTKPGSGNFYATRATALRQRLYDVFFDAGRALVCDVPLEGPGRGGGRGRVGVWSQHAQALAVLTGVLTAGEARRALTTAVAPANVLRADEAVGTVAGAESQGRYIAPASLYFRFYVAEALAAVGLGGAVWDLLEPFREALARGSTTWPESLGGARSECHAWSAWPLYFFARHVLGIAPPAAEDGAVRVSPLLVPPVDRARGRFMTHRGPVDVAVQWSGGRPTVTAAGAGVVVTGRSE